MKHAVFDEYGLPKAFYSADIHGNNIPAQAVEISDEQWMDFLNNQGFRRWDGENVVEFAPPALVTTVEEYRTAIQSLIDAKAQEKQYDSGATLASYVSSTIPQWSAEATAFVAWRDQVWAYALGELQKVQSGEREQPSVEDFLAELPAFEWPSELVANS